MAPTVFVFLALSCLSSVYSFAITQRLLSPTSTLGVRRTICTRTRMSVVGRGRVDEPTRASDAPTGGEGMNNVAKYLVDLHDAETTFDFCGGMMFQLVLSEKLRDHLRNVAKGDGGGQPKIFDASRARMFNIPGYEKAAGADNVRVFHGREIRKVPGAAGGMGFVLQLSLADGGDEEGWTPAEVKGYDGWGHDSGRTWRKGETLEREGFKNFRKLFGPDAFALHHRFYLHFDRSNRVWLSAEDGCEGTPVGLMGFKF